MIFKKDIKGITSLKAVWAIGIILFLVFMPQLCVKAFIKLKYPEKIYPFLYSEAVTRNIDLTKDMPNNGFKVSLKEFSTVMPWGEPSELKDKGDLIKYEFQDNIIMIRKHKADYLKRTREENSSWICLLSKDIDSDYELFKAIYETSPNQIKATTIGKKLIDKMVLLTSKYLCTDEISNVEGIKIFSTNTDSIRVLQIGTPSVDEFISLTMYDHKDTSYGFIIRGKNITQEDIDFIIRNASTR